MAPKDGPKRWADLARGGAGGAPSEAEAYRLHRLACQTDLADDVCQDGAPRDDIEIEITFDEKAISFSD